MNNEYINLKLEDVVSNAFIELIQIDETISSIPIDIVKNYGEAVKNKIISNGYEVKLYLDDIDYFLKCYSEYFSIITIDNKHYFILNSEVNLYDLIKRFRKYISFYALLAFMDKEVVYTGLDEVIKKNTPMIKIIKKL